MGKKLFVNKADIEPKEHLVTCIDAEKGEIEWTQKFPSSEHAVHKQNSFASSTPTCDADRVYVANASDKNYWVRALDHKGNEIWKEDLGPYVSRHGFGTSPILYNDLVIIANDQDGPSFHRPGCKNG